MVFTMHWEDDEHTIIRIDFAGEPRWEDFHQAVDVIIKELVQVSHRMDVIFHDHVGMPPGNPIPQLKAAMSKLEKHQHLGLVFLVASRPVSRLANALVDIVLRVYGINPSHNGGLVYSLEEVRAVIANARANEMNSVSS